MERILIYIMKSNLEKMEENGKKKKILQFVRNNKNIKKQQVK